MYPCPLIIIAILLTLYTINNVICNDWCTHVLDCGCSISCAVVVGSCGTGWDWGRFQRLHWSIAAADGAVVRWRQYWMWGWHCLLSVRGVSSAHRCKSAVRRCSRSPRPRHHYQLARAAENLEWRRTEGKGILKTVCKSNGICESSHDRRRRRTSNGWMVFVCEREWELSQAL